MIDAREIPRHQEDVRQSCLQDYEQIGKAYTSIDFPSVEDRRRTVVAASAIREFGQSLRASSSYLVSEDMTTLVRHAAASFPGQSALVTDLPNKSGFMVFEGELPVFRSEDQLVFGQALGWTVTDNMDRVLLGMFSRQDGRWSFRGCNFLPVDEVRSPLSGQDGWTSIAQTTWTLLQQKIAATQPVQLRRADIRQRQQQGLPAPDVRVVQFRRMESAERPSATSGGEPIERDFRWVVSGHWRNQWLPSVQAHRQQWIAPYVKGPAEKPLVIRKTVGALVK